MLKLILILLVANKNNPHDIQAIHLLDNPVPDPGPNLQLDETLIKWLI